jgi:hypothetical protein
MYSYYWQLLGTGYAASCGQWSGSVWGNGRARDERFWNSRKGRNSRRGKIFDPELSVVFSKRPIVASAGMQNAVNGASSSSILDSCSQPFRVPIGLS